MHNDFVRPSGQWLSVLVPTKRDLRELDDRAARSVNGDGGGAWSPKSPVIIGGSGLLSTAAGTSYEGGVETRSGGRIICGTNDVPIFATTRTKQAVVHLAELRITRTDSDASPNGGLWKWAVSDDPMGWRVATATASGAVTRAQLPLPQLAFHSGGTLSTAKLVFRVGAQHAALPTIYPRFKLVRMAASHDTVSSLLSTGFATLSTPASLDAYFANGAAQEIVMTCDQNNVIARAGFTYALQIEDAVQGLAGNIYHSLVLNFTAIGDARPE
jgi:hypothetical protein